MLLLWLYGDLHLLLFYAFSNQHHILSPVSPRLLFFLNHLFLFIESKEIKLKNAIKLFQDKKIRVEWDSNKEKWYFSIVDVVAVLTDNDFQTARKYWNKLKHRLIEEGNESVTNCNQLKMLASDG